MAGYLEELSIMAEGFSLKSDGDYYKNLGVDHGASKAEIKKRIRFLSKQLHPDKTRNIGTEDDMKHLNKIRSVLLNDVEKKKYDEELSRKVEPDIPLFRRENRGSILLSPGMIIRSN